MAFLGEKAIGILKAKGCNVSVVAENTAVSSGLLINPNKSPRVICADTRVNPDDPDYTRNLKLIGGVHVVPAVRYGGNEAGYRASASLLKEFGVTPAVHVGEAGYLHDCKMFKLWVHDHLSGVRRLELTDSQLGSLLKEMNIGTENLDGNTPLDLVVNTIFGSTIDKGRTPRSLAVDQWFAERLGIGDGHLDILAQAGLHLFGREGVSVKVIVDSKLARR